MAVLTFATLRGLLRHYRVAALREQLFAVCWKKTQSHRVDDGLPGCSMPVLGLCISRLAPDRQLALES